MLNCTRVRRFLHKPRSRILMSQCRSHFSLKGFSLRGRVRIFSWLHNFSLILPYILCSGPVASYPNHHTQTSPILASLLVWGFRSLAMYRVRDGVFSVKIPKSILRISRRGVSLFINFFTLIIFAYFLVSFSALTSLNISLIYFIYQFFNKVCSYLFYSFLGQCKIFTPFINPAFLFYSRLWHFIGIALIIWP